MIADYLARHVDDRVEVRPPTGAKDRGDIAALRHLGQRIVVQCKNTARWSPGEWLRDTEEQRVNDGAVCGIVVAKRHGISGPGDQVVILTMRDLASLLTGERVEEE